MLPGNLPDEVDQRSIRVALMMDVDMGSGSRTPSPAIVTLWATGRRWSIGRRVGLNPQLGFTAGVQGQLHRHDCCADLDTWGPEVRNWVQLDGCREV